MGLGASREVSWDAVSSSRFYSSAPIMRSQLIIPIPSSGAGMIFGYD